MMRDFVAFHTPQGVILHSGDFKLDLTPVDGRRTNLSRLGAIDTAVSWVLGRPGVFLNTVGDIHVLPKVFDAASRFEAAPNDDEMRELVVNQEMSTLFPV